MINTELILNTAKNQRQKIAEKSSYYIGREMTTERYKVIPEFARIVTGVRRCGKSTLLEMNVLTEDDFYLNFEDTALYGFTQSDFVILDDAIARFQNEHKNCRHLIFDEIQIVDGWEIYINQKLNEKYLVCITGSNASLLSIELGTHLTGRHLDTEVFPFSYNEYCTFTHSEHNDESFIKYMEQGGFPEYLRYNDGEILQRLFDDILVRDIAVRYKIRNIRTLKVLALYLASNCGNLITGGKLAAQLGLKTNVTILEYLSYLERCYLFFYVPRYDFSVKSQSINPRKVYSIDTGLIRNVSLSGTKDLGHLFENVIFLHIRRQTQYIWYYSDQSFECDFLYGQNAVPEFAVQVCYELTNENREREVRGLVETCKLFPDLKPCIVTLHQSDKISYNGMIIPVFTAEEFMGIW